MIGTSADGIVPHDWPNARHSRIITVNRIAWHVQTFGIGPPLLLIHGAGGSTHSWADVANFLSSQFQVVSLDLPGQGFSVSRHRGRFGLDAMSIDIAALLAQLDMHPVALIGHSAGAVIAHHLVSRLDNTPSVVSLNGAFDPFPGLAGLIFPTMARALSLAPFVPQAIARTLGSSQRVQGILSTTGSRITPEMLRCYTILVQRENHLAGTLGMMSTWDLDELYIRASALTQHQLFIVGDRDTTVSPETSRRFARRFANAQFRSLLALGHLAQEEAPERIATEVTDWLVERIN